VELAGLAIFGLCGGLFVLQLLRYRGYTEVWHETAVQCGLTRITTSAHFLSATMEAVAGGFRVRLVVGEDIDTTTLSLETLADDFAVTLRPETSAPATEIEVGDLSFDSRFIVGGTPTRVFAALDAGTRRRLERIAAWGDLEVTTRTLRLDLRGKIADTDAPTLSRKLHKVMKVAERLVARLDVPACLAEHARHDAVREVRLNNLMTLAREYADGAIATEALRAACQDTVPEIRRRAALALGDEGRPVLMALLDSDADDYCVSRTVSALGTELSTERTKAILDRALRGRCLETAKACVSVLGGGGDPGAVPILAKVLSIERRGELGLAVAAALGATCYPHAEPPLLDALHYDSADLRIAVASALGQVGSVAAVPALKEAAANDRRDRELESAVRQAVAQIQSRIAGASPGQVSLSGDEAGQLAVSDETGRISIPEQGAGTSEDRK
jgi:hypothetical protein